MIILKALLWKVQLQRESWRPPNRSAKQKLVPRLNKCFKEFGNHVFYWEIQFIILVFKRLLISYSLCPIVDSRELPQGRNARSFPMGAMQGASPLAQCKELPNGSKLLWAVQIKIIGCTFPNCLEQSADLGYLALWFTYHPQTYE